MPRPHNYSANPQTAQIQELQDIVNALEAMETHAANQNALLTRIAEALETIAAKP